MRRRGGGNARTSKVIVKPSKFDGSTSLGITLYHIVEVAGHNGCVVRGKARISSPFCQRATQRPTRRGKQKHSRGAKKSTWRPAIVGCLPVSFFSASVSRQFQTLQEASSGQRGPNHQPHLMLPYSDIALLCSRRALVPPQCTQK
jgi:hypothetical protein